MSATARYHKLLNKLEALKAAGLEDSKDAAEVRHALGAVEQHLSPEDKIFLGVGEKVVESAPAPLGDTDSDKVTIEGPVAKRRGRTVSVPEPVVPTPPKSEVTSVPAVEPTAPEVQKSEVTSGSAVEPADTAK